MMMSRLLCRIGGPWGALFCVYLLFIASTLTFILYNFWLSSAVFLKFFGYDTLQPSTNQNPPRPDTEEYIWTQAELEKSVSTGLEKLTHILEEHLRKELAHLDALEGLLTSGDPDTTDPLSSFKLIKFLQSDLKAFIKLKDQNIHVKDLIEQVEELIKSRSLPSFPGKYELVEGGRAISKIQDVYGLDTTHLATGRLNGHCCAPNFTAEDSFEMVRIEYKVMRNYPQALKWLDQAEKLVTSGSSTGQMFGFNGKEKFLESIREVRSIINKKMDGQTGHESEKLRRKYRALCQGQSGGQGEVMLRSKSLKCKVSSRYPRYDDLLKGPNKVEYIHKKSIYIQYDSFTLREVERFKKKFEAEGAMLVDEDTINQPFSSVVIHHNNPGGLDRPLKPFQSEYYDDVKDSGWLVSMIWNEAHDGGFFVFPQLDLALPALRRGSSVVARIREGVGIVECPVIRGTLLIAQSFISTSELEGKKEGEEEEEDEGVPGTCPAQILI